MINVQTQVSQPHASVLADMRLGYIRHHMARIEDNAQDFTLVNQYGALVNLFDQLETGSVVLAFVHGNDTNEDRQILCQLGALRDSIDEQSATLMVLAPHSHALQAHRVQCRKIDAEILHDLGNRVAYQYGLIQEPSNGTNEYYEEFASNNRWSEPKAEPLPAAAVYVIGSDHRIAFSYAKTGHSFELNTQELLATLA